MSPLFFLPFLLSLLISASVALAAPVEYTSEYRGEHLPLLSGGTIDYPAWFASHSAEIEIPADIGDNALEVTTNLARHEIQSWVIGHYGGNAVGTSAAWQVSAGDRATVDFTIQITSESGEQDRGFQIALADGTQLATFFFSANGIFFGPRGQRNFVAEADHRERQTYRIVLSENTVSLYRAGTENPILEKQPLFPLTTGSDSYLLFGNESPHDASAFRLYHLGWTILEAEYSAPTHP